MLRLRTLPRFSKQRVERERRVDLVRHRRIGVLPRDVRAVRHREVRLVVARHRLLARQHDAGLQRFLSQVIGDHLVDRDAGVDDRTSRDGRSGEQASRLRRVDALARRVLVEEAVDDVDLLLDRLERRQAQAELHVVSRSGGAPVVLVDAVAHEEHSEALGERRARCCCERGQRLEPRQRHGDSSAAKDRTTGQLHLATLSVIAPRRSATWGVRFFKNCGLVTMVSTSVLNR